MAEGEQHRYQSRMFADPELERVGRETTLSELRSLPKPELVRRYDLLARAEEYEYFLGPDEYLRELTRRETERQSKRLEWLTWAIIGLTVVLVVLELLPRISGAAH